MVCVKEKHVVSGRLSREIGGSGPERFTLGFPVRGVISGSVDTTWNPNRGRRYSDRRSGTTRAVGGVFRGVRHDPGTVGSEEVLVGEVRGEGSAGG